ncbi:MAG TPA: YciI family protein [Sporichthyaceae bacterium]|jgi:hypothetical protein
MTHLLLEYRLVPDFLERREAFRAEHLGLLEAATQRGELALGGAVPDLYRSMMIWREDAREALAAFVAVDPYVLNGVVESWTVHIWNTAVGTAMAST